MADRPYTILSCAVSLDGYLDDASERRLLLSCSADLARVDALRAGCDAILVGATTIRRDDPHLLVRAPALRAARVARGLEPSPLRVTLTRGALLDPQAAFFAERESGAVVYCPQAIGAAARRRLGTVAAIDDTAAEVDVGGLGDGLWRRGVRRLLVEGGGAVFTQFLAADRVDELQLAIAPIFVGERAAPRFVGDGRFPWRGARRATLVDARQVGDVAVLRYALSPRGAATIAAGAVA